MKTPIDEAHPGWGKAKFATTFALVAAFVVVLAVPLGLRLTAASPACPADGPIAASSLPAAVTPADCDLRGRTITDGPAAALVPAPGTGVRSDVATATGTRSLTLQTQDDGTVVINPAPELGVAAADGETRSIDGLRTGATLRTASNPCKFCQPACSDNAYVTYGYRWDMSKGIPYPWYFQRSSTPKGLSADNAQKAFINATNNIVNSRNQCGLADEVNLTAEFKGDTKLSANINTSGGCTHPDGVSVIDFGLSLAPGQNCSWYFIVPGMDTLSESDIRMQSTTNWTTHPGRTCNDKFDLGGLTTHERGHTFGLGHPDTPSFAIHGNLTMSTYGLDVCSKVYRTFGKGDVQGLRELYP